MSNKSSRFKKLFETYVVHLACLEWSIKEEAIAAVKEASVAVKKAQAETRQANLRRVKVDAYQTFQVYSQYANL